MTNARVTRESRQQKAAAMRAQAARAEARRRSMIVTGAVLAVIALIVAIFVIVQNAKHTTASTGGATPTGFDANYSVTVGKATAPVTVIAYEDFQCPVCRQFEQANAAQLEAWVKAGTVKIEYRPIAFLDRSSTTNYSTRALNAAAALVTLKPTAFATFHKELFNNQPAEGSAGLSNQMLIALAVQAGAPQAGMTTAINNQSYKAYVTGTPTVKVNGKQLSNNDAASVKAAVDAALAATK